MNMQVTGRPKSDRAVPGDFHQWAAVEGDLRLRARYSVGRPLILRWRQETGIYCGAQRGPKRSPSRPAATRQKPFRSPRANRYSSATMDETLSWLDAQDDITTLMRSSGIEAWYD